MVWSQEEIKGKRVAQSECYCLRLNVSKATMMMPSKAGGCLDIGQFLLPGVPTLKCQDEKGRIDEGGKRH